MALVQVAAPELVVLVPVHHLRAPPPALAELLASRTIVKVGVGASVAVDEARVAAGAALPVLPLALRELRRVEPRRDAEGRDGLSRGALGGAVPVEAARLVRLVVRPWHPKRHHLFPRTFTPRVVLVLLMHQRLEQQAAQYEQSGQPVTRRRRRLRSRGVRPSAVARSVVALPRRSCRLVTRQTMGRRLGMATRSNDRGGRR